jgi:hypothetical protein
MWTKRTNLLDESIINKPCKIGMEARLPEFFHGLGFNLPNAFACDTKNCADLFKRITAPIRQTKPKPENFSLSIGEGVEDLPQRCF